MKVIKVLEHFSVEAESAFVSLVALMASSELQKRMYGNFFYNFKTFLFLFSIKMVAFRAEINKMLVRIANREDPDLTAFHQKQSDQVCAVCLGLFGRGLVFDILEQ